MKNEYTSRFKVLKKIYPYIKSKRKNYVLFALVKLFFSALGLIGPLLYLFLVNEVMIKQQIVGFVWVVLGYVIVYLIETLLTICSQVTYNKVFIAFNLKLRHKLLKNILYYSNAVDWSVGESKNILEDDSKSLEKFLNTHILDYFFSILNVAILISVLIFLNWKLAIVSLFMIPLSFVFTKIMSKKAKAVAEKYRNGYACFESYQYSCFQNWREIKSNCIEECETKRLEEKWKPIASLFMKNQILWYINRGFIAFKDLFITKMNLYFVGGLLIISGHAEIAMLLTFMKYYEQLYIKINNIIDSNLGIQQDAIKINNVLDLLYLDNEKKPIVNIENNEIVIKNLNFQYFESAPFSLNNLNLFVKEKEHIAIVGKSGSGKSTLIKIMGGILKPTSGIVCLGGHDIYSVNNTSLYKKIGIVMQDTILFNMSIRDNLLLANPQASKEELSAVCRTVGIFDFINSLPQTFDTVIGERGIKVSGGQKQRISLARMLLYDPDVIVFDESTSSLDIENENLITKNISEMLSGKTIISVAHRLTTIKNADRIIVLNNGKILSMGKHEDLLNNCKEYRALFLSQERTII